MVAVVSLAFQSGYGRTEEFCLSWHFICSALLIGSQSFNPVRASATTEALRSLCSQYLDSYPRLLSIMATRQTLCAILARAQKNPWKARPSSTGWSQTSMLWRTCYGQLCYGQLCYGQLCYDQVYYGQSISTSNQGHSFSRAWQKL